jgi:hypothetical protein
MFVHELSLQPGQMYRDCKKRREKKGKYGKRREKLKNASDVKVRKFSLEKRIQLELSGKESL